MKQFNEDFKNKLYQTISEIEDNSLVEVVTIIRQNSNNYKDVGLRWAAILTGIIFTAMMIVPFDINVYIIYFITIVAFVLLFLFIMNIPSLLRLLIPKKRIDKEIEIMSRAIFQKGGIRYTQERIGVLFYVSFLEKKVKILADRGAKLAVPQDDWKNIQNNFDQAIISNNVADKILEALRNTKDVFSEYIPPVENDINELPDDIKIDL